MYYINTNTLALLLTTSATVLAYPPMALVSQDHYEVLRMRVNTNVDPSAVTETNCLDPDASIAFHDQNIAELAICGGIAGPITKCRGAPTSTIGLSGTAIFHLEAMDPGATINLSKRQWEACVRAAVAVCPTGSFESICIGGASTGDVVFALDDW